MNASSAAERATVKRLGLRDYTTVMAQMRAFTEARTPDTPDELWLVEHPPVYTLGQAGRREHLLRPNAVPLVQSDRGGQITYHGPGQAVVYVLIDLKRQGMTVRDLVRLLEEAVVALVAQWNIVAHARPGAPGVYVGEAKIAALGLRVHKGRSYHGIALNVAMDLGPFDDIDPCGFRALPVTQLKALGVDLDSAAAGGLLADRIAAGLRKRQTC